MISVPSEPSSLAMLVTGLGTVAMFLYFSGQWRYLRYYATGGQFGEAPTAKATKATPSYLFCGYERRFVFALGEITARLGAVETKKARVPAPKVFSREATAAEVAVA